MGDVFREITFQFNGEDVTLVPSLAVLRRVKASGINTAVLAQQAMSGGADPVDMCVPLQVFLGVAGVKNDNGAPYTMDEAYGWLVGVGDDRDPSVAEMEISSFLAAYVSAVLPQVDLGKKPEAQPQGKNKRTRKKTT
jgi:hypothetical protein